MNDLVRVPKNMAVRNMSPTGHGGLHEISWNCYKITGLDDDEAQTVIDLLVQIELQQKTIDGIEPLHNDSNLRIERLEEELSISKWYHELAIKERDLERLKVDRLKGSIMLCSGSCRIEPLNHDD